jgi:hypothetical protein
MNIVLEALPTPISSNLKAVIFPAYQSIKAEEDIRLAEIAC